MLLSFLLFLRLYIKQIKKRMKTKFLLGITAMFVIVLAGCGPTAHIETSNNANFDEYRSFAWVDAKGDHKEGLMEERVKDAISRELRRTMGWKEDNRTPDVLLSYDLLVERGSRLQSDPMYSWGGFRTFYNPYYRRFYNVYYPSKFMGYDTYEVSTREGTVAITMVDSKTEKTILQGWATDEVDNRRMSSAEVDRIVTAIFKKWEAQMKYRNNERYLSRNDVRVDRRSYPSGRY